MPQLINLDIGVGSNAVRDHGCSRDVVRALPGQTWSCGLLAILSAASLFNATNSHAAATEPYGLDAMAHFDRLPYLKLDTMAAGQSSFDRTGGNGDWGNYLYSDATGNVMLDMKGPGTIYRFWTTGFDRQKNWIKFYFDGETTPRIDLPLREFFSGKHAPFLAPLVANDEHSSGGFFCYLPLPFAKSIKIVTNGKFYYNIGFHTYSPDTAITTWTGSEDSSEARRLWSNVGQDPKPDTGNVTDTKAVSLAPGATETLLDITGPSVINSLKLHVPGITLPPPARSETDDGRAHKGYSQFQLAVDPANQGVRLVRRYDHGIANQKANVLVDGAPAGTWFNKGADGGYNWRDDSFNLPARLTAGKSNLTVKIVFVSSSLDWNEFRYWAWSKVNGAETQTDMLDVDNADSEARHQYVINNVTWEGTRTYQYPPYLSPGASVDLLTNLWLRISFDDEAEPSVEVPLGSFFAMGQFAAYATRGLPVGLDAQTNMYCYFPMPFAKHAVVQLVSRRTETTDGVTCEIKHAPFTDSFANVGCFKTRFNSELPTTNGTDILFLDTEGSGHFCGVVESMMGPLSRAYLEGDERIYVDDSQSPAFYGTGTEDFYNAGWYFNHGLFTQPTHGNPAHVADGVHDCTTAYRLFLADAIPFRKHLRAGIEHGGVDDVAEDVWTLAYYYFQPKTRLTFTDRLDVGDPASEAAHHYSVTGGTWSGSLTNSYDGNFDHVNIASTGRAHRGTSEFTLAIQPDNAGVILRRRFDQMTANQSANVYVDGTLAGTWYHAGSNKFHRWRDDDFVLPVSLTRGKSSLDIKIEFVSSGGDWNEFTYYAGVITPP